VPDQIVGQVTRRNTTEPRKPLLQPHHVCPYGVHVHQWAPPPRTSPCISKRATHTLCQAPTQTEAPTSLRNHSHAAHPFPQLCHHVSSLQRAHDSATTVAHHHRSHAATRQPLTTGDPSAPRRPAKTPPTLLRVGKPHPLHLGPPSERIHSALDDLAQQRVPPTKSRARLHPQLLRRSPHTQTRCHAAPVLHPPIQLLHIRRDRTRQIAERPPANPTQIPSSPRETPPTHHRTLPTARTPQPSLEPRVPDRSQQLAHARRLGAPPVLHDPEYRCNLGAPPWPSWPPTFPRNRARAATRRRIPPGPFRLSSLSTESATGGPNEARAPAPASRR
jgi:hypothetical protein